jgi:dTDP-4-amino-4,6-dideoxygalactose transaminase
VIRFQAPLLPPVARVAAYFAESERIRWYANGGPCHARLVERLQRGLGAHCVPVASATLGLMICLRALTADRGARQRRVLMPSYTFAATIEAVLWAGLEPVFLDVEPEGWHLDPAALERGLRTEDDRVAAVLTCSTFGTPPPARQRAAWESLAREANVALLVDSAAGFGATADDGLALGHQGDAEVFSFHATKPFAIGEGGLVVTDDADLAAQVRRLTNFGFAAGVVDGAVGLNAKLSEWGAATALAVLDEFDTVLSRRRAMATVMVERLAPHGYVGQAGEGSSAWQFVPVLAPDPRRRDALVDAAQRNGVELRRYFSVPLHRMPAFADHPVIGELECTEDLARRALSLPMANDLSMTDVDAIVASLVSAPSPDAARRSSAL